MLEEIAEQVGTPCYVYDAKAIEAAWQSYDDAYTGIPHEICYAVKANSNLAILSLLARRGSGFDIVSGGELYRVLIAGGDPKKIVFSGVGKTANEIAYAIAEGVQNFNVESEPELVVLAHGRDKPIHFALRVNPNVNAATHPYISTGLKQHKFGIDIDEAVSIYNRSRAFPHLIPTGVSCHIGSQMLELEPMIEAADKVLTLAAKLKQEGHPIDHVDLGGGLGIAYEPQDCPPKIAHLAAKLKDRIAASGLKLYLEPGRSIVGAAGILLTRVLYLKTNGHKNFIIVDAGMNDLIRPALYQAHHEITPVRPTQASNITADIVGPVCESGDFLAKNRDIPTPEPGDLLTVRAAGAYGFSQASNYNSRPKAAEVLIEGETWRVIRERETYADLIRGEKL